MGGSLPPKCSRDAFRRLDYSAVALTSKRVYLLRNFLSLYDSVSTNSNESGIITPNHSKMPGFGKLVMDGSLGEFDFSLNCAAS